LSDDPQSTTAWAKGSEGERRLAEHLLRTVGGRAVLLHDRKVPHTRGNIDHIAIAASGVWVIDAKNYNGLVERRDVGGWFKTASRQLSDKAALYRMATHLCDGLDGRLRLLFHALRPRRADGSSG
jgi:hypothetical protein